MTNSNTKNDENFPATGRLLGLDYGTVRIGIAVSDPGQQFAGPLDNYTRRTEEE
ncbi:Putative Holliday junction resolvase YqgF, partial [hydrothermal vent metagenome]